MSDPGWFSGLMVPKWTFWFYDRHACDLIDHDCLNSAKLILLVIGMSQRRLVQDK